MTEKIKVFIGVDPNGCDLESQAVLEWSLRKNTNHEIDIEWMMLSKDPNNFWYSDQNGNGWNTENYATPFSAFRWGIPARCNYEGKAIYMDSDMIVLSDISKLWNQSFDGKAVIAKGQSAPDRYCVMLMDCEHDIFKIFDINKLKTHPTFYSSITQHFARFNFDLVKPFEGNWNCIDGENLPLYDIDIFHHSSMEHQLCHKYSLPRLAAEGRSHWYTGNISEHPRKDARKLFDDLLTDAIENGYNPRNYTPNDFYGPFKKAYQNFNSNANPWVVTNG